MVTNKVNSQAGDRAEDDPAIAVIDGDPATQEGLKNLFAARGWTAMNFPSAEAFLAAAPSPGCAIVELHLPGISGLEWLRQVSRTPSAPPVVMMSGDADVASVRAAMRVGAVDFLEKPLREDDLVRAIEEALSHGVSRDRRASILGDVRRRIASLTERERQVFSGITDGLRNREIATRLGISVRTVESHRTRVMLKLGAARVGALHRMRAIAESEE